MNPNPNSEKKDNLEINLNQPSSLVPLQIRNFVKEINTPIEMKIRTNDRENMETMTGGNATTNNGFFGYFKSFFQGFSQQSIQKKKHDTQNNSYLNSLFYSGNEEKSKKPNIDNPSSENEEDKIENPSSENEEDKIENPSSENEEDKIDNPSSENEEDVVITKIILTTEDPEMILRESLKGTKLYYLAERKDLPSQWV